MTTISPAQRRLLRREAHASRTGPAVFAALLLCIACLAVITATVAVVTGSALPARVWEWIESGAISEDQGSVSIVLAAAVVLVVGAIIALVLAVAPGKLARHGVAHEDYALVFDDGALAATAADAVAARLGLSQEQVVAELAGDRLRVRITPTSGVAIAEAVARDAAAEALAAVGLDLNVSVAVTREGVLA